MRAHLFFAFPTLGASLIGCSGHTEQPALGSEAEPLSLLAAGTPTASTAALGATTAAPVYYEIQRIDPFDAEGEESSAVAINSKGIVTGTSDRDSFLYRNCASTKIPRLPNAVAMFARDINDNDTVVGFGSGVLDSNNVPTDRAFASANGTTRDLGGPETLDASVVGPGDIAAGTEYVGGPIFAVYYLFGQVFRLPPATLPTSGTAAVIIRGMNRSFSVVGNAGPFGYVSGGGFTGWSPIAGFGDTREVRPMAINDNGHITGTIGEETLTGRAFLAANPSSLATALAPLSGDVRSRGMAINVQDVVVGESESLTRTRAVLWQNGAVVDLNTVLPSGSGWSLVSAKDINDQGMIVGFGSYGGKRRGFLLVPHTGPVSKPTCMGVPRYLAVNAPEGGTITAQPGGSTCGKSGCLIPYEQGTTVTLSATVTGTGHVFSWTGCDSTLGLVCKVVLDRDRAVVFNLTSSCDADCYENCLDACQSGPKGGNCATCRTKCGC